MMASFDYLMALRSKFDECEKFLFVYQDKDDHKWYVDLCRKPDGDFLDLAAPWGFETESQATVWAVTYGDKYDLEVQWDEPVCAECGGDKWINCPDCNGWGVWRYPSGEVTDCPTCHRECLVPCSKCHEKELEYHEAV